MTLDKVWLVGLVSCALVGCPSSEDVGETAAESMPADSYDPEDPVEGDVRCGDRTASTVEDPEWALNAVEDAALGLALLEELGAENDNVLVSPMSMRSAFGQVYAGTTGTSRDELAQVFGFDALGDRTHAILGGAESTLLTRNTEGDEYTPPLVFRPANRSYFDLALEDGIDPAWSETVKREYGVCLELFDLNADQDATIAHVNGWVANQTNDLIPGIVKFLPERVTLILVNALYFKAAWAVPFEPSLTQDRPFTTRSSGVVQAPTMRAPLMDGRYASGEGWQAVALPYTDQRLEMVVILPDEGTDLESTLDATALDGIFGALQPGVVDLSLPKFDLFSSWSLRNTLMSMGLSSAFVNDQDFVGIAKGMAPIAEVFHDVALIVDEEGTEAAAATAIVFGEDGGGEDPSSTHTVVVDRTFYVAIRDREVQNLMFFARIGDPKQGG